MHESFESEQQMVARIEAEERARLDFEEPPLRLAATGELQSVDMSFCHGTPNLSSNVAGVGASLNSLLVTVDMLNHDREDAKVPRAEAT